MNRKLLCFIMIFIIALCNISAYSEGSVTFDVSFDLQTNIVKINGQSERSSAGEYVTLTVLNPNEHMEYTLSSLNDQNAKDIIYYQRQTKIDENKGYSFEFKFSPEKLGGYYSIIIGINGITADEEQRTKKIFFPSALEKENALTALNSATANDISDAVDRLMLVSNIFDENYEGLKDKIDNRLLSLKNNNAGGFSDLAKAAEGLKTAILMELIFNSKITEATLKKYMTELDKELMTEFSSVSDSVLNKLTTVSQTSIKSLNELNLIIRGLTALSLVNNSTRSGLTDVILKYSEELTIKGLAEYTTYEKANSDKKITINAQLTNMDFKETTDFVTKFKAAVKAASNQGGFVPPSSGNNSPGTGSGRTSTVSLPLPEITEDNQTKPVNKIVFNDIESVDWAKDAIEVFSEKGIISGIEKNKFGPDMLITREQFIKILVLTFNLFDETAVADFSDCTENDWFYKYVASAKKAGITDGIGDGTFGVGQNIKRQDIAVMLARIAQQLEIKFDDNSAVSKFSDFDTISDYAKDSVSLLQAAEIIKGNDDNKFFSHNNSTRAEAVVMIFRIWKIK